MLQFWFVANTIFWPFGIEVGGFRLGLNVISIVLVGVVYFLKIRLSEFVLKVGAVLFVYTLLSLFVGFIGLCTDKFEKSLVTIPVFIFVVMVGLEIGWRASEADWLKLQKTCAWILLVAFGGFIAEFFGLVDGKGRYEAYSGIFIEPSHVAFSLFPSIAILLLAQSKSLQRIGMLALLGLLIFSRSSTLIILTISWVLYQSFMDRKITKGIVIWAVLISITFLAIGYDTVLEPFLDRIFGVASGADNTVNISSLVYLQGWQDVWVNLNRTYGLGLGFNMMGCTPLPAVDARATLLTYFNIMLNTEDGSFVFSKLGSEAGVFGILFLMVIVWWFIKLVQRIRKFELSERSSVILIQTALIFLFLLTSVLRGGGYFNAAMLLWLVALAATIKNYGGPRNRVFK